MLKSEKKKKNEKSRWNDGAGEENINKIISRANVRNRKCLDVRRLRNINNVYCKNTRHRYRVWFYNAVYGEDCVFHRTDRRGVPNISLCT